MIKIDRACCIPYGSRRYKSLSVRVRSQEPGARSQESGVRRKPIAAPTGPPIVAPTPAPAMAKAGITSIIFFLISSF
ncbi:hypothetical protein [Trichormus sp. NMC-1]|uniref:hypothetical protein n=1 Tax=Trichormus sp. NMC-1 TaxID=1853259 RepID=UPI0015A6EA77|nr:hypothetical protein [Trichormus sp. NMC-1]